LIGKKGGNGAKITPALISRVVEREIKLAALEAHFLTLCTLSALPGTSLAYYFSRVK